MDMQQTKEKAEKIINDGDEKFTEFIEKHELDKKVEKAAGMLEDAAKDVVGGVKNFFNKNQD